MQGRKSDNSQLEKVAQINEKNENDFSSQRRDTSAFLARGTEKMEVETNNSRPELTPDAPTNESKQVRDYPFAMNLTEAEGVAIETLRNWTRAQVDPEHRKYLETWDRMHVTFDQVKEGNWTVEEARQTVGNYDAVAFYNAAITLHGVFAFFGRDFGYTDRNTVWQEHESFADHESFALLDSETKMILDGTSSDREGKEPLGIDEAADPEMYAIARATAKWVQSRRSAGKDEGTAK